MVDEVDGVLKEKMVTRRKVVGISGESIGRHSVHHLASPYNVVHLYHHHDIVYPVCHGLSLRLSQLADHCRMPSFIFTFRLALYSITLISVSFLAVFIGVVSTLLGKRLNTNYYVARTFWHIAGPIMGWKFEVEGEEYLWRMTELGNEGEAGVNGRSAVMVGNHQR